jgi:GT2 family glycosyltransferase
MTTGSRDAPSVSAIVIGYNSWDDLAANLEGPVSTPGCEVILVDNGSSDGSAEYVRTLFPDVSVIASPDNLGFGGGANLGASRANADVLLFLNPDISIDDHAITALTARVRQSRGIAGPVILDEGSGERQYGFRLDLLGMTTESLAPTPPLFVQGCALAIDAGLFGRIGGFEARYFLFSEDAELCWRAAGAGAAVDIVADAQAFHGGGHSIPGGYVSEGRRQIANARFTLRERNTLAMFLSNAPLLFLLPFTPIYLSKVLAFAVWAVLTGRRPLASGLVDALTWNVHQLPETLARRRSRPGQVTWAWLRQRLVIQPAIITHLHRHGWPAFIGAGSPDL